MTRLWRSLILLAAALAAPAAGHHSVRAAYDPARPVTITGTLTRIDWRNPHAWLEVRVSGEDGTASTERVEMAGPGSLIRRGVDPDVFRVGQTIRVEAWPPRADAQDPDAPGLAGITVILPDGRRLDVHDRWGEGLTPPN